MTPYMERNRKVIIKFKNSEDAKWLFRFKDEFQGFRVIDVDMTIEDLGDSSYRISYMVLKEFLYTYTWGEGSWNREINERVGIMDSDTYIKMLEDVGFEVEDIFYSKEEYEKYLVPKIDIMWDNRDKFIYPFMNIIIVGVKK